MIESESGSMLAMYFVVANQQRNIFSYTWRIGQSGTSFYAKARYLPLGAVKISLHGPDPRPDMSPGFKIAIEEGAVPGAEAAGGVYCGGVALKPTWFSGRRIKEGVTHVLTFRTTWDLFVKGAPSAPNPGDLHSRTIGLVVPAPSLLKAADVDIYVSDRKPYWPREARTLRDESRLGPIQNKAGQYLTGVSFRRSALGGPPDGALALKAQSADERVRGIGTGLDGRGVLWIVEHWMSSSVLKEAAAQQAELNRDSSQAGSDAH